MDYDIFFVKTENLKLLQICKGGGIKIENNFGKIRTNFEPFIGVLKSVYFYNKCINIKVMVDI